MIEERFGRLKTTNITQIREEGKSNHKTLYCQCKCDCGKELFVRKQSLLNGNTKSCGCYRKDHCQSIGLLRSGVPPTKTNKSTTSPSPIKALIRKYKYNSLKRGILFELSDKDFSALVKKNCYYCNKEPLQKIRVGKYSTIYNGVDRLDSSKGYSKENCVSCCKQCNIAKSSHSLLDFFEWIKKVYNKHLL